VLTTLALISLASARANESATDISRKQLHLSDSRSFDEVFGFIGAGLVAEVCNERTRIENEAFRCG